MPPAGKLTIDTLRQSLRSLSRSGSLAPIERHLESEGLGHLLNKRHVTRRQAEKIYDSVIGSDAAKRLGVRSGQLVERNFRTEKAAAKTAQPTKPDPVQKIAQLQKRARSWRDQITGFKPTSNSSSVLQSSRAKVAESQIAQGKKDAPAAKPTVARPATIPLGGNISVASGRLGGRRASPPSYEREASSVARTPESAPVTPPAPPEPPAKPIEELPI